MKATLRKLTVTMVNNDMLWYIIKPFAKLGFFAFQSRKKPAPQYDDADDPYLSIFKDKKVLHGPFAGMRYPAFSAAGSSFYPKMLGCYEKELHETIDRFKSNDYTEVVDIGCAEGYYAVGLGLLFKDAKICAYDIDEKARRLCHDMAKLNGTENNLNIKETCTAAELAHFKFSGKALVICDCEGYEQCLFDQTNIENLKNCDLLIETHDFIDINISGYLEKLFGETHHIQSIKSIDDIEKAKTYSYPETDDFGLEEKMKLYRECRPAIMEWLVCTPKLTPK